MEELSSVQAKVVQKLMQHGGKNKPVYVTGHSQCGAEAALATRALLAGGFSVVATYTFVAARPGDRDFAQSIPESLPFHRIEFGNDIVPHVPPTLINNNVRAIVEGMSKIPLLSDQVKILLHSLQNTTAQTDFVSAGRLCYGNNETKALLVEISAEQEAEMFNNRLMGLVSNPKNWADHHHLTGTSAEVSKGDIGNYLALVSKFPLVI